MKNAFRLLTLTITMLCLPALADSVEKVRSLLAQGQLSAAEQAAERIITEAPQQVEARLLMGVIQAKAGRLDDAIDTFRQITLDHPDLPQAYNNLAAIHAGRGEFEQAREILIRAIEGNPSYPVARENLGDLYANMAQIEYQRALMLQESNHRIRDKADKIGAITGKTMTPPPQELAAAISNAKAPSPPSKQQATTPTSDCYLIGPFAKTSDRSRMERWLTENGIQTRMEKHDHSSSRTMVYLPGGDDFASTNALLNRVRRAGVRDTSLSRTLSGQRAISLGVFGKQSSVTRRLKELRAKGFEPSTEQRASKRQRTFLRALFKSENRVSPTKLQAESGLKNVDVRNCPA